MPDCHTDTVPFASTPERADPSLTHQVETRLRALNRMETLLLLLLPVLTLATVACGPQELAPAESVVVDLASDLPFARHLTETESIAFGEPGSVEYLGEGWSHVEEAGDGRRFRWAVGRSASLRFRISARRDHELVLSAKPYGPADGSVQRLSVVFNGADLATFEMKPRWSEYRLAVPASFQRLGDNEVIFRFLHFRAARQTSGPAHRRLAVAFERLSSSAARVAVEDPKAGRDPAALFLPFGTRLEYFASLPEASRLRASRLRVRGKDGGTLVIEIAEDTRGPSELSPAPAVGRPVDFSLLEGRPGVIRLSLSAAPARKPMAGEGILLEDPVIVSRAPRTLEQPSRDLPRGRPVNLLVYLVDTLRTDALGLYSQRASASPVFDAFASEATLFRHAVGQSSWTRASVASLFTGLWPVRHGAIGRLDTLAVEAATLPEILQRSGYATAAFVTNPNVTGKFGFAQGFDEFNHIRTHRASDEVNQRVFSWLTGYDQQQPFFLYVHTMDPHHPYLPPTPLRPEFARTEAEMRAINRRMKTAPTSGDLTAYASQLRALYDAAAHFNDSSFGELLDFLRDSALLDTTVIVFLSDHGEEFLEHGEWQHGKNLHAETLNMPLAIRFPDVGHGQEVSSLAGHVDLLPTLLDYLGVGMPADLDGVSLLSGIETPRPGTAAPSGRQYAHLSLDGHDSVAVIDGEWKFILRQSRRGVPHRELYHWTEDPGEQTDLSNERPVLAGYLESLIARKVAAGQPSWATEEAVLDEELERSLRALGYLQ